MEKRRVVVTGVGCVTPLGLDARATWSGLCEGRSGVGFIEGFAHDKLRSDVAAAVKGFDPSKYFTNKETDIYGRVTQLAFASAKEALAHAGLDFPRNEEETPRVESSALPVDPTRIGCLVSTGQGAVDIFEEQILKSAERGPRAVSPYFIPGVMLNGVSALIAMRYGMMGPSYNIASACATGTHSIATSALMIEADEADVMIAGGAEAATRLNTVAGFGNARALARSVDGDPTKACRPFDKKRAGFVMGEGAGSLVLEEEEHARRRGAPILARVAGFGMTSDGDHITRPHPEGLGVRLAIERAIRRAGIAPDAIDYVNPHATATQQGDIAEYGALKQVFGERLKKLPISATKSMLGHLLGGAGAVESIVTVLSIVHQRMHPSINAEDIDPIFELDLLREARSAPVAYALKNSSGFGGHNCALVFAR